MSNLAGNFISQQIRMLFSACQPPVHLTPHYLVSSKTPVDAGAPANATYRSFAKPPQESFRRLEEERVLSDFKESVVQIWGGPGRLSGGQQGTPNEEVVRAMPGRPFEMPDGWNQVFGPERFRVAEGIYDAKMAFYVRNSPLFLRMPRDELASRGGCLSPGTFFFFFSFFLSFFLSLLQGTRPDVLGHQELRTSAAAGQRDPPDNGPGVAQRRGPGHPSPSPQQRRVHGWGVADSRLRRAAEHRARPDISGAASPSLGPGQPRRAKVRQLDRRKHLG